MPLKNPVEDISEEQGEEVTRLQQQVKVLRDKVENKGKGSKRRDEVLSKLRERMKQTQKRNHGTRPLRRVEGRGRGHLGKSGLTRSHSRY